MRRRLDTSNHQGKLAVEYSGFPWTSGSRSYHLFHFTHLASLPVPLGTRGRDEAPRNSIPILNPLAPALYSSFPNRAPHSTCGEDLKVYGA
jgi:hypothetical protein